MKALLLRDEPFIALCPVLTRGLSNLPIQCWTFETPTAKSSRGLHHLLHFRLVPSRNFVLSLVLEGATNVGFKQSAYPRPIKETNPGSP
jgi:hypothetical protein